MRYGLWDTVGRTWLGNEKGPLKYEQKDIAMFAAESLSIHLGYPPDQVKALEFTDEPLVKTAHLLIVKTSEEVNAHWDRRERGES